MINRGDIEARRKALGLSRRDVAERAGITEQAVHKIERTDRNVLDETLAKVSKVIEHAEALPATGTPNGERIAALERLVDDLTATVARLDAELLQVRSVVQPPPLERQPGGLRGLQSDKQARRPVPPKR